MPIWINQRLCFIYLFIHAMTATIYNACNLIFYNTLRCLMVTVNVLYYNFNKSG